MFKLVGFLLLCVTVTISTNSFSEEIGGETTKYVIFDTDVGADDAWALQMVLSAEKHFKNVKLLAITTVDGNTDVTNVIKNTYRILDGLNRTDVPIYKGAAEAIIPINLANDFYYGKNGFGDLNIWKPHYPKDINSIIQKENAVEIIRDSFWLVYKCQIKSVLNISSNVNITFQYPQQISILCIAPPTNLALAIKSYPEIAKLIKEVVLMGGSFKGRGNVLPAVEFNFYRDPESVYIILNTLKGAITILPLDVDEFMHISSEWRFNILGKINHTNVQLLNEIEKKSLRNGTYYRPYDAFAASVLIFPEKTIQIVNSYNASVELAGHYTRGQMFTNLHSKEYNVKIVEKMDEHEFKKTLLLAANHG